MTLQRLHPATRYSEATIHQGTVYLAGQVPRDAIADIETQTRDVLEQIDTLLTEAGSDRDHLLSVTIYLSDLADYDGMNRVWDAWLRAGHAPPRACVQARLANPAWKLEIVVVAAVREG